MKKLTKKYRISLILSLLFLWLILFGSTFLGITYLLSHFSETSTENTSFFQFEHPKFFWLNTLIIPFFIGVFFLLKWKNKTLSLFSKSSLRANVPPKINNKIMFLKLFFLLNFILFSIISLSNPIYGKSANKTKNNGVEIMIALDISNSMNSEDINKGTSRLEIAKKAIEDLLNKLHGDKVGFVIFAGNAYTQMPMTTDYESAKTFLKSIETDMISNQGTNLSEAINVSMNSFDDSEIGKTIILITDGEDQEEGAIEIAKEVYKKNGVIINVIGLGTEKGGMIPLILNGKFRGYKKTNKGDFVISKINKSTIKNIALAGGGISLVSDKMSVSLNNLVKRVSKIHREEIETDEYLTGKSRYFIFAFLAFASLFSVLSLSNFKCKKLK